MSHCDRHHPGHLTGEAHDPIIGWMDNGADRCR